MNVQKTGKHKLLAGLLAIALIITCLPTMNCTAETTSSEQQFQELYLRLLETGDTSVQDISTLNLPYMTCYNIMNDVKNNAGYLPYQCYTEHHLLQADSMETVENTPYLRAFHLTETDEGFLQRYKTVQNIVSEIQKNIDASMSDLDKLLYFHEYVVENIYYYNTNETSVHFGGCTLAQGYGVCDGYAGALMIFLKAENIPCVEVIGGEHAWVAVQIDKEWYLVDPTWDDTSSSSYGTHYFLMRNDDEFENTLSRKHEHGVIGTTFLDQTSGTISTSTKYTDWYVHDVWNRMYYYDGYWYYVLNNAIRKNNIQGTDESVLFTSTNLTITGIEDGVLYFSKNGTSEHIDLPKKAVTDTTTDTTTGSGTTESPTTDGTTGSTTTESPTTDSTTGSTTTESPTTDSTTGSTTTEGPTTDNTESPADTPTADNTANPTVNETPTTDTTTNSTTPETPTTAPATNSTISGTPVTSTSPTSSTTKNASTKKKAVKVGTPVIKSVTNKKGKKLSITLKKKVSGATGYEVKISTNKNFKKSVKTVYFTKTSTTITKLTKNKTYYVKVRAYKKDSKGKKIYGSYSTVKKIKIKK